MAQDDSKVVRRLSSALLRAVNESDLAGVCGVWAAGGILMPPHHPSVSGGPAIRAYFEELFRRGRFAFDFTASAVEIDGNMATERVAYVASFFPAGGGDPYRDTGKGLHVFRRQPSGDWRLAVDIWNSDNPIPAPNQPPDA